MFNILGLLAFCKFASFEYHFLRFYYGSGLNTLIVN